MSAEKPVIVFLHAALGTSKDLAPLMRLLEDKGHRTLTFDFSGHGKTAAMPDDFRIDTFARELDAFLRAHKLTAPTIFGHSMGGYVALYHKANYEDSPITHIFTYGTKFNWSESAVMKELPMLVPEHLEEKFPALRDVLIEKHGERWKHLLRSTAHLMRNLERLDGLTKEDLAGIEIPVCLLLGDQDRLVSNEETQLAHRHLHHSEVKTITHSKHDLDKANVKEIATVMEDFLV
jgi:pimeloyl-ACP methyl ester carboxylesterase